MKIFNRSILLIASVLTLTLLGCGEDQKPVIGLDYAAKFGKITVTLDGTRLDDKAFKTTKEFKLLPDAGPSNSEVFSDGTSFQFVGARMHGAVDNYHNDNYARFTLNVESGVISGGNFSVVTFNIDSDGIYYYLYENFPISSETISGYSYNEETGNLKFNFSAVIDSESGSTGHDLTLSGSVNITVFKNVGVPL